MQNIIDRFNKHLIKRKWNLECFYRRGVQVEGWLKGELLYFLEQNKKDGYINDYDREVAVIGRKKVDFKLFLASGHHWIEIKHWHIGKQKNNKWGVDSYFDDSLENDIWKLGKSKDGLKWILALCTENPGKKAWQEAISKFHKK